MPVGYYNPLAQKKERNCMYKIFLNRKSLEKLSERKNKRNNLFVKLRKQDLNLRPLGYEPSELTELLHSALFI